mmetsp:Transcript_13054/g.23687  ORF Transcript_13054/g.23687 Transcript_13054/m.23687 type:complete len:241 (+) Transcript_13054:1343-2065(+)
MEDVQGGEDTSGTRAPRQCTDHGSGHQRSAVPDAAAQRHRRAREQDDTCQHYLRGLSERRSSDLDFTAIFRYHFLLTKNGHLQTPPLRTGAHQRDSRGGGQGQGLSAARPAQGIRRAAAEAPRTRRGPTEVQQEPNDIPTRADAAAARTGRRERRAGLGPLPFASRHQHRHRKEAQTRRRSSRQEQAGRLVRGGACGRGYHQGRCVSRAETRDARAVYPAVLCGKRDPRRRTLQACRRSR